MGTDAHLYDDASIPAQRRYLASASTLPRSTRSSSTSTHGRQAQNEAILSINIFQKDLSHMISLVSTLRLRTMPGIRLDIVAPPVLVVLQKCARASPYARKCVAFVLRRLKLYDLLVEEKTTFEEIVDALFSGISSSSGLVGAPVVALNRFVEMV